MKPDACVYRRAGRRGETGGGRRRRRAETEAETMNERDLRALERWIDAEREGRESEAEEALGQLFSRLPRAAPPADFADRVLARVDIAAAAPGAPPAAPSRFRPGPFQIAVAACLMVAASVASLLAEMLAAASGRLGMPAILRGLVEGFVEGAEAAGRLVLELMSFGDELAAVGRALGEALVSAEGLAVLATLAVISALGLRLLYALVTGDAAGVPRGAGADRSYPHGD